MFVARRSAAISVGTTAIVSRLNNLLTMDTSKNPDVAYRKSPNGRIFNTHASQIIYYKRDKSATITSSNADGAVGAGKEAIFALKNIDEIQLLGSGATTTGYLEVGTSD